MTRRLRYSWSIVVGALIVSATCLALGAETREAVPPAAQGGAKAAGFREPRTSPFTPQVESDVGRR